MYHTGASRKQPAHLRSVSVPTKPAGELGGWAEGPPAEGALQEGQPQPDRPREEEVEEESRR